MSQTTDCIPEEFRTLDKYDVAVILDILSAISRPIASAASCCMVGDEKGLRRVMAREVESCDFDCPEDRADRLTKAIRRHRAVGRIFMQIADCLEKMK